MNSIFGFPSPADDYLEHALDLNHYLVKHPAATFFVRYEGEQMQEYGIYNGDILVVDRALPVKNHAIVLAVVAEQFLVRQVVIKHDKVHSGLKYFLRKPDDKLALLREEDLIWGPVTASIRCL